MKYTIKTKMTKSECIEYTKQNVPRFGWYKKSKYLGYVNEKGFKITINSNNKNFYKQNSFRPINVGKFEEDCGVTIRVKQRLAIPVILFSLVMCTFLLFAMATMIATIIYENDFEVIPFMAIPIVMLLILITGIIFGIKYYGKRDMEEIKKLYEGK